MTFNNRSFLYLSNFQFLVALLIYFKLFALFWHMWKEGILLRLFVCTMNISCFGIPESLKDFTLSNFSCNLTWLHLHTVDWQDKDSRHLSIVQRGFGLYLICNVCTIYEYHMGRNAFRFSSAGIMAWLSFHAFRNSWMASICCMH